MSSFPARYQLSQAAASRFGSALMLEKELLGVYATDVVEVWSRSAAAPLVNRMLRMKCNPSI